MVDKDKIEEQLLKWTSKTFGNTFKFREHQKECIINILTNWLSDTKNVIIQAPTGSGKSITALCVAGVLSEYYKKRGYVLISDLGLIEQYANDLEKYIPEWSVIKGQQMYTCSINGLQFSLGACQLAGCKSYGEIHKKYSECASTCEYLQVREKAIYSNVTVCTYAFWLIQQNYVKKALGDNAPFTERDFVICDEAHKLVEIIQSSFSPTFKKIDETELNHIFDEIDKSDRQDIKRDVFNARKNIFSTEDRNIIFSEMKKYVDLLGSVSSCVGDVQKRIEDKRASSNGVLSKMDRSILFACSFFYEHISKFGDYCDIIGKVGTDYMVKNTTDQKPDEIVFNCLDESYLLEKVFHAHCKCRLYMSATIGNFDAYAKSIGVSEYASVDIPSTFDFTNSPIFYIKNYRLSYNEKEMNLPYVVKMIDNIIKMYSGKRGIIQTGSYSFSKYLIDNISAESRKRILGYENSDDKQDALFIYKESNDRILVGPSLIEGLSFDDDLCRFQIIMKTPFPSLADKFVSAKAKMVPGWYNNATSISVLQGIGRGIRHKNDWCVTFILDGCFSRVLSESGNMFNEDFYKRIQIIEPSSLGI